MKKQVYLLTAIRSIRMFLITMPIIVIYWQSHGLTMQDIFILQVVFSVVVVLFELPSGRLADKYGRKKSVIAGSILGTSGFFVYWMFPTYEGFIFAEMILALSAGFMSGARDALLYETLQHHSSTHLHTKYQGRIFALGNVSEATAAILAGIIVSISSIQAVLLIQWIVISIAIPLSLMLTEVPHKGKTQALSLLQIVKGVFAESPKLRALNIYSAGISAGTLTMVWFAQPYWKVLNIDILHFGYLWAGLNIIVAVGSVLAHRLEKQLSFRVLFASMALFPFLLYIALSVTSAVWLAMLLIAGFWLLRGVSNPIIMDYIQRESIDGHRSTIASINELSTRLVFSIFSPFVGWIADVWSFGTAFMASGLIFGIISIIGFLFLYREMRLGESK